MKNDFFCRRYFLFACRIVTIWIFRKWQQLSCEWVSFRVSNISLRTWVFFVNCRKVHWSFNCWEDFRSRDIGRKHCLYLELRHAQSSSVWWLSCSKLCTECLGPPADALSPRQCAKCFTEMKTMEIHSIDTVHCMTISLNIWKLSGCWCSNEL